MNKGGKPLRPKSRRIPKGKHPSLRVNKQSRMMANRRSRKSRRPKGRKVTKRAHNGAFTASTLHTKHVYLWSDMSGTRGKWYKNFTIQELTRSFQTSFDEFKLVRITCSYRPNNASTDTGLYVGVLLDQSGFGKYDLGTEVSWFRTLATFPGSKIRPRSVKSNYVWYPTEPTARDWYRYQTDSSKVIATLYIADNGQETVELGGVMELFVTLKARGLYWNASVKSFVGNSVQGHSSEPPRPGSSTPLDFEALEIG